MVDAASAEATPLSCGLPEEIIVWEILLLLPPKSILRCRAVCRAWRLATSTHEFLLAHHSRQPSLPIAASFEHGDTHILGFDHRAAHNAQPHTVAWLDGAFYLAASCDGLLVLSRDGSTGTYFSICNLATREYAPIGEERDLNILGMYPHRPTGGYRLLLYRKSKKRSMLAHMLPRGRIGCYVLTLGSDQPPRYIGWPETGSELRFKTPALARDNLHWLTTKHETQTKLVVVFDTIAESFRQMGAPVVPDESTIFEMDGTLGIYTRNIYATKTVDIWVLHNYESEVWDLKYQIELPVADIMRRFGVHEYFWNVKVVPGHSDDVLLLISFGWWLLHIDTQGRLVGSFRKGRPGVCVSNFLLKQSLVQHTFFTALDGHVGNASLFK